MIGHDLFLKYIFNTYSSRIKLLLFKSQLVLFVKAFINQLVEILGNVSNINCTMIARHRGFDEAVDQEIGRI